MEYKFLNKIGSYSTYDTITCEVMELVNQHKLLDNTGSRVNALSLQYYDTPTWNNSNTPDCTPYEQHIVNIMPQLENTELSKFINEYNIFRCRIFVIMPHTIGYSVHQDRTDRIHLPIQTTPECYFNYYPNGPDAAPIRQEFMVPDGSVYRANTTKYHTFINNSNVARIHVVGGVV